MSVARYCLGCAELVAIVAPIVWAAGVLRSAAMPAFTGARAALAQATVVLAWLVVEVEVLGSCDELRGVALSIASLASGLALGLALRRGRGVRPTPDEVGRRTEPAIVSRRVGAALALAVGLVVFEQLSPTLRSLSGGISEFDSLAYHLPTAARWVQEGSLSSLHQLYPGSLWAYYPYNAEILHAVGMAAFGRDLLSPFVNIVFLALALLAAWAIGSARGAGTAAVLGAAMALTTLQFALIGGGTALNDVPAVAMVLVTVALVSAAPRRSWEVGAAALAGGWAIATKPDAAATIVIVAGGAIVAARDRRVRATAIWVAGLLVAGGYWYVRDLIAVGTPLPGLRVAILSTPRAFPWPLTFVQGLHSGADSISALPTAFNAALGPTWPVVVGVAVVGLLAGLARDRMPWERAAALGGIANIAIWPFTPFTQVVAFAVRYMAPGLLLGAILLACAPWLAGPRRRFALSCGFAAAALVAVAHVNTVYVSYRTAAVIGAVAAAAFVLFAVARRRRPPALVAPLLIVVLMAIGEPGAQRYLRGRYSPVDFHPTAFSDTAALTRVFAWARGIHHARIGLEGGELQYPLYGPDLSNYVQYIGHTEPGGGYTRIARCDLWRRAIDQGHFNYVITVPWGTESNSRPLPSPQGVWTRGDPAASPILQPGDGIVVFAIRGRMSAGC